VTVSAPRDLEHSTSLPVFRLLARVRLALAGLRLMQVCVLMSVRVHTHTQTHTDTHTRIRTHTRMHARTHTYTVLAFAMPAPAFPTLHAYHKHLIAHLQSL